MIKQLTLNMVNDCIAALGRLEVRGCYAPQLAKVLGDLGSIYSGVESLREPQAESSTPPSISEEPSNV